MVHIKAVDIYTHITKKIDTTIYKFERPLPITRNKKSDWINEG